MEPAALLRLIDDIAGTPQRVRELMARVPPGGDGKRPRPDAFSARENVHHLHDVEADGYGVRLARLLEEEEPTLADLDGDGLSKERRYAERPWEPALDDFARLRATNVARLRRLSAADLLRAGFWTGVGPVTLEKVLGMWRDHDRGHLDEIAFLAGVLAEEPKHNF